MLGNVEQELEDPPQPSSLVPGWLQLTGLVWAILIGLACGRAFLTNQPRHRGVFAVYLEAGCNWSARAPIYDPTSGADFFAYSPACAAVFAPLSLLPEFLASFLWRSALIIIYLAALARWLAVAAPAHLSRSQKALIFLLVIPVTGPTLVNAQAGALVIALLLFSLADAALERWSYAAFWIGLATLIEVYPLVLGGLLALAYPRAFLGRLVFALLLCVGSTFLLQDPGYVTEQYAGWLAMLRVVGVPPWAWGGYNCDIQSLLTTWFAPLDPVGYHALQLLLGGLAVWGVLACRRTGNSRPTVLFMVSALGSCWMILVGPAVESFTYILIGPVLAWLMVEPRKRSRWEQVVLGTSWGLLTLAMLAQWTPYGTALRNLGPHPVAGLLLLVCLLARLFTRQEAVRTSDHLKIRSAA